MIILIRHGEADHHVQNLTGGWTDSALTEKGRNQLQHLAGLLAREFQGHARPFVAASDLVRAKEGAGFIAHALGDVPVHCYEFLREKNNGRAAGLTVQEARAFYHAPVTGRELDHVNYDGGETRRSFYQRTIAGAKALLERPEDIIIVSHKGTIQNILFYWLGLDIEEVACKKISFDIRPASLTVLGVNKWGERAVFVLNDTGYLHGAQSLGLSSCQFAGQAPVFKKL